MSATADSSKARTSLRRRFFRRGPWENVATGIIGLGVIMLCQPFLIALYSYSFVTILTGTVLYTIVTKFRD
ncbi:hypothetical protein SAMN05444161_6154 [Rhizobiales bacterium GAS191]|jgi:hypothetical protein|nr:hypothetical protein SAMN05519103_05333 [Rhizobiales bacterium GAS113]SEE55484.1 hypothetical protein SAMN05444161_6154 [Rhizobiales bacterium GAS191]